MNRWLPLFLLALFLGCFGPNAGARYYEPNSGRFLSPDPLGHAASMSLYDYCNGDPVNGLDPDGRCGNSSWSDRASAQIYGYGKTATDTSIPFQYKEDPVNWGQVGEQMNLAALNMVTQLPGLNVLRSGMEMMTGKDLFTGQSLSASRDLAAEFTMSLATTAAMFVPLPGAGVGVGAVGEATIIKTSSSVMRSPMRSMIAEAEVAAESSVWSQNPFVRGRTIEQSLGANLPSNFPTIDRFSNGVATSIKSLDLGAATYQNTATLSRTINGYVDSVAAFNGRTWAGVSVDASQITARQLQLAVPGAGTAAQQAAINAAVSRAQGAGVQVLITPFP